MWTRRRSSQHALTFLEVMIVIVILGTLIAVAAPRMKGMGQRSALIGGARELAAGCNAARQAAISTERTVLITINLNADQWWIDLNDRPGEEDRYARYNEDARHNIEKRRTLPPKVSFLEAITDDVPLWIPIERDDDLEDLPVVLFYPNGTSSGIQILVENERGKKMTVQVARSTGRVEVYEGEPRTFEDKLKDLGVDPSAFLDEEDLAPPDGESGEEDLFDPNAERREREAEERQSYYQDVLGRILDQRRMNRPAPGQR